MINTKIKIRVVVLALALAGPSSLYAFTPLDDKALSRVAGQDGISIAAVTGASGISAQQLIYAADNTDVATPCTASGANCAFAVYEDITLRPIGPNGSATTDDMSFTAQFDADERAGTPFLGLQLDWTRSRLEVGRIGHQDSYLGYQNAGNASFGNFAMDSSGHFHLYGGEGLLSTTSTDAEVELNIGNVTYTGGIGSYVRDQAGDGQIFFRQGGVAGTPELSLDNVGLLFSMPSGTVGVDSDGMGLLVEGPAALFDFTFDLRYDPTGASPFAMDANDLSVLFFGWRGTWLQPEVRLWGGGSWPGGTYSEGLSASLKFNMGSDYKIIVGEAGSSTGGMFLEFGNPTSLPYADGVVPSLNAAKDFEVPLIALDVIHAGQGPGGLCFGLNTASAGSNGTVGCSGSADVSAQLSAEALNIAPEDNAFAILGRDWALRAYSGDVRFFGPDPADDVSENWALIYTFGDNDGNIYLYPQTSTPGLPTSNAGMKADIAITMQTFGTTAAERWRRGTHFLIGDTDKNLAVGLVGVDAALLANDLYIATLPSGLRYSSNQVRFNIRGMFGGGDLPNMLQPQSIAYADLNLESDNFEFTLEPAPIGQNYLGYSAFVSLAPYNYAWASGNAGFANDTGGAHGHDDGSYFSLAEPNTRAEGSATDDKLNVDFRLARIQGDMEFRDGKIDLQSANETASGRPQLVISNQIRIGRAATLPGGGLSPDVFEIGAVEFGAQTLGRIVIPQAQINASITLKQQL